MKLTAETRTVFGKKVSSLRREGLVPGELYGHGKENAHVSVAHKDLARALHEAGHTGIIALSVDGKDTKVLAHEWTRDAKGEIEHVDFYAVKAGEKIRAEIPLVFSGEAPAVKEGLGTIVKNLHEVEVEALPEKLPHDIAVDVSSLAEAHASIHASDLKVPAGVELLTPADTVVVSIAEVQDEPEEIGDVAAVVVEGDEKAKKEDEAGE